jgi:redox-sensitive bicupin YhaK (pirin superfamily)
MKSDKNYVFHKAGTRGYFDFGWLQTYHSFSFGNYFNPERMQYGALRVLNDDTIDSGKGFGTHPHENMEIVTIPLKGELAHKDSMGNGKTIRVGEVQIMSAGTGITHSEFNPLDTENTELLQIWVLPKEKNIVPRYGQKLFPKENRINQFQVLVSPNGIDDDKDSPVWINQDAYFSIGNFDSGKKFQYKKNNPENLLYTFLISGKINSGEVTMEKRDGMGSREALEFQAEVDSEVLVIEIPGV